MCFFGADSLLIQANVQKFIENKKYNLKAKMDDVITKVTIAQQEDLKIGSAKLELERLITSRHVYVQSQLLNEIRQKLFGRNATAKGSVMFVHDDLWFFPNQLQLS
jgi:galactitol-specific phosphotransferase system IIB component